MADSRPAALVTDAGYVPGLTVVRSLGRAGVRVVATHADRRSTWARSVHAAAWYRTPSPETHPLASAKELARIAHAENVDVVIPTTDKTIFPLDENRHLFDGGPALALPPAEGLRIARDKQATTAVATQLGIPVPQSVRADSHSDAVAAAELIGWPVVVKPLSSHAPDADGHITTRSVFHASDRTELEQALASPELGDFPVQIQERVDGTGVGVELLIWDGETVASFQHRRRHEVPLTGGMSSLRVAERPDPELLGYSERLLRELKWEGVAMVEFKVGETGPRLLEVNGRFWGSIALPVRAGVDFPLLLANQYLAENGGSPVSNTIRPGVECRNLELELRWLTLALRDRFANSAPHVERSEIARTVLALLNPTTEYDAQIASDWRPGLHDAIEAVSATFALGARFLTRRS